jgi:hypothetical protein
MYNPRQMAEWKRPLLIGVGWGLGTAVGLAILVGGFFWYQSRPKPPKPPKPWDTASIKAEFNFATTEGDKNTFVFFYTLENTTDFDYRAEVGQAVINARLEQEKSLVEMSALHKNL